MLILLTSPPRVSCRNSSTRVRTGRFPRSQAVRRGLLIESKLRTSLKLASRIYLMEKGAIVHDANAPELSADPTTVSILYLGVSSESQQHHGG